MIGIKDKSSSYVRQAAILAIASLIVRFIGFLYRMLLTDKIGDAGNGIYGAGYSIYTFLLAFSASALPSAISRMVSQRIALKQYGNAHKVFKVSIVTAVILGTAGALLLYFRAEAFAVYVENPQSKWAIMTLSPTILIVTVISVYRGYYQGMNTMVPTALSQVVEQIFNAVFSVWLAYVLMSKTGDIAFGAAGGTAGTGIGALAGLILSTIIYFFMRPRLYSRINRQPRGTYNEPAGAILKTLFITAAPIIIGATIASLTSLIDMKMVMGRLLDSGVYDETTANKLYGQLSGKYVLLTTLPVSFSTAFATAIVPNIARAVALRDSVNVKLKTEVALRMTMIISIPAAIGLGALADPILFMLFPNFKEGGLLLQVGSITVLFLSMTQICTGILQGIGKVYVPAITTAIGLVVKIILNHFLIINPEINVMGAVISTIACYLITAVLNFIIMSKAIHVKVNLVSVILKPLFASAIMGATCYITYYVVNLFTNGSNTLATLTAILTGLIAYCFIMLLIRGITKYDVEILPGGKKLAAALERFWL